MGVGTVGCTGSAVVRLMPTLEQQKFCCAIDQCVCKSSNGTAPGTSQLSGSDVDRPDSNQHSMGIGNKRLKRQQVVMIQVKSRLGRSPADRSVDRSHGRSAGGSVGRSAGRPVGRSNRKSLI